MYNHIGKIHSKVDTEDKELLDKSLSLYRIIIPVISLDPLLAYVVSLPGIHTEYREGDKVIVTQSSNSHRYLIIGLLQEEICDSVVSNISINTGEIDKIDILDLSINKIKLDKYLDLV